MHEFCDFVEASFVDSFVQTTLETFSGSVRARTTSKEIFSLRPAALMEVPVVKSASASVTAELISERRFSVDFKQILET